MAGRDGGLEMVLAQQCAGQERVCAQACLRFRARDAGLGCAQEGAGSDGLKIQLEMVHGGRG